MKIYHETNFVLKSFDGFKVTTIHNLSFIHCPECQPKSRARFFRKYLPETLMKADCLITCTEYIKRELVAEFGISKEKITGHSNDTQVNPEFRPNEVSVLTGNNNCLMRLIDCWRIYSLEETLRWMLQGRVITVV